MLHGICDRSSDQLKYLVERKGITIEAIKAKDDWDSDVENKANTERIAAGGFTQVVKVEKGGPGGGGNGGDANNMAHRKRCRELLTEQNLYLPFAGSLKMSWPLFLFFVSPLTFVSLRLAEGKTDFFKRPRLPFSS